MGLTPVFGINRVGMRISKISLFIEEPDIWKIPGKENDYVVFGNPVASEYLRTTCGIDNFMDNKNKNVKERSDKNFKEIDWA